jgi:hypothetical protein
MTPEQAQAIAFFQNANAGTMTESAFMEAISAFSEFEFISEEQDCQNFTEHRYQLIFANTWRKAIHTKHEKTDLGTKYRLMRLAFQWIVDEINTSHILDL